MEHYIYIFTDPRKTGKYSYPGLDFIFEYEPFYVGKGKGNRYKHHLFPGGLKGKNRHNRIKCAKLEHIISSGFNPLNFVVFLYRDLTEAEAMKLEVDVIKSIGRINEDSGPLANLNAGGDFFRSSSLAGKTLEEIYGEEKAALLREDRRKMVSGEKNPQYGKKPPNLDDLHTPEIRLKIKSTKRENSKPIYQIDKDTNEIISEFQCIIVASEHFGVVKSAISNCIIGRAKTSCGYKWCYKEDYEKLYNINNVKYEVKVK